MKRNRRKPAEVDITPLIDMMFMLIIFFVLTSSFVNGKISVDLPSGTAPAAAAQNSVTVSVLADGGLLWNGKRLSENELVAKARGLKDAELLIAGDKKASYGRVAELLSLLRREGITSAGLLLQNGDK